MELHSAFKMLLNKEDTVRNSEKIKAQAHPLNYTGGKPVQNASEELWAKLNIPVHMATLKGENSREKKNP